MTAQDLLQNIQTAGGVARIKTENGVAKLNIAPSRIAKDFASEIKKLKPALLELLDSKTTSNPKPDGSPSSILTKWHSRGARLWLGTTTHNGQEYRTLEYEFDSTISPKWLKELERDKGFIQTALVAQEVRELSARYWAERKAELEAVARKQPPSIDWEYVDRQRALQDALSAQLGPRRATQAIYEATNEILTKWKGVGKEASKAQIHQAALELLCIRYRIPFDDCFDTEISIIPPEAEPDRENSDEAEVEEVMENEFTNRIANQPDTTETTRPPQSEADTLTLGF